ncbi:ricin-type beta-trefoil lectin domain protein [Actinoplanes sp. Pm04-4]|uniref:Ricin-type beta-trefoil lectin domain protein n=1 Tax=Paractinoplanes pyxinae TaxID=2997416 RepID=A0ABT4BDN0_9ACTN|nr:ricin-type beta-trefoil lectin domain protein [Actinoplanes pyxinae]MCY1144572.1 ricin-type beta-trefoil lectin domain protein [Actinoplanes pyxinae]
MTNGDQGDERDPLLVRPFVLRDSGTLDDDESHQTWPAANTSEARAEQGPNNADAPTAILHLPFRRKHAAPGRAGNGHRRRVFVLAATAAAVVLGATAAGYAAFRDDVRPAVTTGLPGGPLPAATAPLPTSAAGSPAPGTSAVTDPGTGRPAAPGTGTKATTAPTGTASSSATTTAPGSGATTSPSPGEPISLVPSPTGGGGATTAPTKAPAGVAPQPPASDRVGVIRGQNNLCLDLNGAVAVDGNHVQVYDCNNSIAQSWTLATDGTLRVQGKCALAVGDNTVEIVGCDGRTPAQWRVSNQRLINAATGTCLTDPSSGRNSGTGVTVTPCTGSANQRWSLP